MSSISQLSTIQKGLTRYGMSTYLTLGNIGLLFNIIIFTQAMYRRNPCSLYICAASICSLIGLNISLIPGIYGIDHINSLTKSLIFCQFHFYLLHIFNQSMRTFIVVACADRYATCSHRPAIRFFSRYQIAVRLIPSILLFWTLLAIFPTMMRSLVNGVCDTLTGIYNTIYSIYILVVLSIFPLTSMITFGILINKSLKQIRARVVPVTDGDVVTNHRILRKRDRDMMRMLLVELFLYVITTIPATIALVYKTITESTGKNREQQEIESFIFYFTRLFLLYLNNSLSFWIYIITSASFRIEFKNLIIKWYHYLTCK